MATKAIVGEKVGMTQVWTDDDRVVPVTVVRVQPARVVQVKTTEPDGYTAVQVTYGTKDPRKLTKPKAGHFAKAGGRGRAPASSSSASTTCRATRSGGSSGPTLRAAGDQVDVTAVSKGKGFAGAMKRHGFNGLPASHGAHRVHRAPGSIGACATPSRVFKGTKMAGRMGGERVTTQNLEVVSGRRRGRRRARAGRGARPQRRRRAHPQRRQGT